MARTSYSDDWESNRLDDVTLRRLTMGYLLALCLIAFLAASTHVLLNDTLAQQKDAATIVNVAGRQRMLSQRIALLAQDLEEGAQAVRGPLIDAVNLMERSQNALIKHDDMGISSPLSAKSAENYFGGSAPLDDAINKFVTVARRIADMAPGPQRHQLNANLHEIAINGLLPALDRAVSIFEAEANQRVASSLVMQKIVLAVLLLTLVAEAFLIFRPMISTVREHANKLYFLATYDGLTSLPNRRFFGDAADRIIRLARRSSTMKSVSALVIDIDHFKRINDSLGHAAGDAVLKRFGDIIRATFRTSDIFGRIGGEEFAVVLPETDLAGALLVAERLRCVVEKDRFECNPSFTISVGVTTLMTMDIAVDDMLQRSDEAMYFAKSQGRNCIAYISDNRTAVYNPSDSAVQSPSSDLSLRKTA